MSRGSTSIAAASGIREPLAGTDAGPVTRVALPADGSPVLWRTRAAVTQVCLIVPEATALLVCTGDRDELTVPISGAVVLVGHERFAVATPGCGRMLVVTSPRAPIEALAGSVCGTVQLRKTTFLGATALFLGGIADAGGGGAGLERVLRELIVAALLEARASEPAEPPWVGLFDRATEHIAGYRTDHGLCTESLARALNISVRQLQRTFAAAGTTPQGEIRRHRAALAATVLGDRAFAALSVDQIGHQCGFGTAAEMRRALAHHGLPSPRLLRTPVRDPSSTPSTPSTSEGARSMGGGATRKTT